MRASTVRLRMSEGGMWASEGGWIQCFRVACGPLSPERCRLMLERDPRTDKVGHSSVAHGAKTVAFGGRWVKCAAQRAGCVRLMYERGALYRAGRNAARIDGWLRLLCVIVVAALCGHIGPAMSPA